jgi:hypothetical protein
MRSYDPEDKWDRREAEKMQAPAWMLDIMSLNPSYPHWGPWEDYMWKEKDGWDSRIIVEDFSQRFPLDKLNEVVNFYFNIYRERRPCLACDKSGYNPGTKIIADTFYDFDGTGQRWCDRITQDEVDALQEHGRLRTWNQETREWVAKPLTAEQVNAANSRKSFLSDYKHDGINRCILIEMRATRLGVWGYCPECNGEGFIYTSGPKLRLVLWVIHPRKGASRGMAIQNIQQSELPEVFRYLREAADRNAERFSKIPSSV